MQISEYEKVGQKLVRRFGSRDPEVIIEGLGIRLYEADFDRLKGMYRVIKRNRCIFINKKLDPRTYRIVLAHEIGHDQLHREYAKGNGLQEFMLYRMNCRREYEANMVAAAILLPDDEVREYIYDYNYDAEQIAREMDSDVNLVALKIAHLQSQEHKFRGMEYNSKFLK